MKQEKFEELVEEISEFIAERDLFNRHYLTDEEIIKYFQPLYKKKHIKLAIAEVR
jgi:hypothetical protein